MQTDKNNPIEQVVERVCQNARYNQISGEMVRRLAAAELDKGRSPKESVKAVRSKLHQVGSAYQEKPIDYPYWLQELAELPSQPDDPAVIDFCRRMMQTHASTNERLSLLEPFYAETLASLGPLYSVLDVGCGLNPLALPWLPLAQDAVYHACDIYHDMIDFLEQFFAHIGQSGSLSICDLTQQIPSQEVQIAFLFKTVPCLEQLDKNIGPRLIEKINAQHLLITFPLRSLGGRGKGMLAHYSQHFEELTAGRGWHIQRFEFVNELAYLVSK